MKRTTIFLLILLGLFCLTYQVQAADDDIYNDGYWRIDSSGIFQPVTAGSSAGYKVNYEVMTATQDTLATTDTGKRMIYTSTSTTTVTLPAAALGLEYSVIAGGTSSLSIDPATTDDTIIYYPSGTALSAGDKMTAAATGDSVTLVCGKAHTWYVKEINGSWTDGN
jgi:hypothetical protein